METQGPQDCQVPCVCMFESLKLRIVYSIPSFHLPTPSFTHGQQLASGSQPAVRLLPFISFLERPIISDHIPCRLKPSISCELSLTVRLFVASFLSTLFILFRLVEFPEPTRPTAAGSSAISASRQSTSYRRTAQPWPEHTASVLQITDYRSSSASTAHRPGRLVAQEFHVGLQFRRVQRLV